VNYWTELNICVDHRRHWREWQGGVVVASDELSWFKTSVE